MTVEKPLPEFISTHVVESIPYDILQMRLNVPHLFINEGGVEDHLGCCRGRGEGPKAHPTTMFSDL